MKLSNNREVNSLVKSLIDKGFTLTGYNKHIKLSYNNRTISISKSPSDGRWMENVMKDAKRAMA